MLEKIKYIETETEKYPISFTFNVMEIIQEKYGSIDAWMELISKGNNPDIGALKFFITEAINEGIDIENEKNGTKREFITGKKAGRILTEVGISNAAEKISETISYGINEKNEQSPQ